MPRHHTVPEVYLKGFFDPAKVAVRQNVLWLYEENRKICRLPTRLLHNLLHNSSRRRLGR